MRATPQLTKDLIAATRALPTIEPLAIVETGGYNRELSTTLPNGNVLSVTNDDGDLPGYFIDDPDIYAWVHTPDSTDPLDEVFTTDPTAAVAFITRHAEGEPARA